MPDNPVNWVTLLGDDELDALIQGLGKADEDWAAMLERQQEVPRQWPATQAILQRLIKETRRRLQDLPPATIEGPASRCQWPKGCPNLTDKTLMTTRGELYLCDQHIAAVEAARAARQAGAMAEPAPGGEAA